MSDEPEIVVTPRMLADGLAALRAGNQYGRELRDGEVIEAIYRAMRRAELAEPPKLAVREP